LNRLTDVEIPRAAWSSWRESGKPRQLRRALTGEERTALLARRDELAPFTGPMHKSEQAAVVLALSDMFGSFPSMRSDGENAAGRLEAGLRVLAEYPGWAIQEASRKIQLHGVWREGKFDRHWPPSDAEIAQHVRAEYWMFRDTFESATKLLEASVEDA
jgi:hypothetical protein